MTIKIELGVENRQKPPMIQLLRVTEENGCCDGVERGEAVEGKLVQNQWVQLVRLGITINEQVRLLPFPRLLESATTASSPGEQLFVAESRSESNSHRSNRERCTPEASKVFPIMPLVWLYLLEGSISIHVLNSPARSFRYRYTSAQRIIRR